MNTTQTLRTGAITAGREYQELPAWQKGIAMAEAVYAVTEAFPEREHLGLALQMRQSAIKVPGHIAAASARLNDHGMSDSYSHAQSAAAELITLTTLATRLGYMNDDGSIGTTLEEIERLLIGMKHALKVAAKDGERKERETHKLDREHNERNERYERKFEKKDRGDRGDRPYKSRDRDDRGGDRPYKKRDDRDGDRPRRDYSDKPRGDRPYKSRDDRGGDKPRGDRPYKSRDDRGGDRPRRDFGDKPRGGDRGPRKPYRKD